MMQKTLGVLGIVVLLGLVMVLLSRSGPRAIAGDLSPAEAAMQTGSTASPLAQLEVAPAAPPMPLAPRSNAQWVRGSWLRVHAVPVGCEIFPVVDGVAFTCEADAPICGASRGSGGAPGGEFKVELAVSADAPVVAARATRCESATAAERFSSTTKEGIEVSVLVVRLSRCSCGAFESAWKPSDGVFNGRPVFHIDAQLDFGTQTPPPVCFASIGDWGKPFPEMLEVATQLAKAATKRGYRFIVSTGDNFYPVGVKSATDPQFESAFEAPYSAPALRNVRWYICAGNHDQWGLRGQLEYGITHARWFFPRTTYASRIPLRPNRPLDIITLDTYGRGVNKQLGFLDSELAASSRDGAWKLVLNHAPLYSGAYHGQQAQTQQLRAAVGPLLRKHRAHMYVNGDDHTLEVHRSGPTDFFVSGAGGGSKQYTSVRIPEARWFAPEGVRGFMQHCVEDDAIVTTLIDQNGAELYVHRTPFDNTE